MGFPWGLTAGRGGDAGVGAGVTELKEDKWMHSIKYESYNDVRQLPELLIEFLLFLPLL